MDQFWPPGWRGGGHVIEVAVDPSNPSTVYAGTTLGGVCVSTDSGAHWAQMNEGLNHTDIGTIAVSPSGDTLYAATCGGVFDYETG